MAAENYFQMTSHRNKTMRRTAPPRSKRIDAVYDASGRHQSAPQRSRLEQMQQNYQKKLLKEKEEKIVALHKRQQDQAELSLQRVNGTNSVNMRFGKKKGVVREYFKERRQMVQDGRVGNLLAPSSHLQKIKLQQQSLHQQEKIKQEELQHFTRKPSPSQSQQKMSGYSKSTPLAPIKSQSVKSKRTQPPLPNSHFETFDNLSAQDYPLPQKVVSQKAMRRATQLQNKSYSDRSPQYTKSEHVSKINRHNDMHPKNLPKVASGKQKSTFQSQIKLMEDDKELAKQTDFQKWQIEQDNQREARLHNYEENLKDERKQTTFTYDIGRDREFDRDRYYERVDQRNAHNRRKQEYDDMNEKEKELEALIAKHQVDLAKFQLDDSDEDDDLSNENGLSQDQPHQNERGSAKPVHKVEEFEDRYGYDTNQNKIRSFDPSRHIEPDYENEERLRQQTKPKLHAKRKPIPPEEKKSDNSRQGFSDATSIYTQAANEEQNETTHLDLRSCQICGRKFAVDRLPKHKTVCKKISSKKRKIYDSIKHRTEGTGIKEYVRQEKHLEEPTKKRSNNWRKKHDDFVNAIRDARKVQAHIAKGGKVSDLPPPPPAENPDYKQCPYCKRRFNATSAERHIPHCKDAKSRPKPIPRRK